MFVSKKIILLWKAVNQHSFKADNPLRTEENTPPGEERVGSCLVVKLTQPPHCGTSVFVKHLFESVCSQRNWLIGVGKMTG